MDPDSGSYLNSSTFFKASVLTISFTSIYFYTHESERPVWPTARRGPAETAQSKFLESPQKKKKKKTIYLSFDDGPDRGTMKVLHILREEQIPASVFVIGEHVYGSKLQHDIWDSLSAETSIEKDNHSFSHAFENRFQTFYSFPDSAVNDFKRCADSLDLQTNIVRLPGRNIWRTSSVTSTDIRSSSPAADSIQNAGFTAVGWDLEWHFTPQQTLVQSDSLMISQIDSMLAKNQTKTAGHLVLLAHDRTFQKPDDSASLHMLIKMMKKKDEYEFKTVSEYPGINENKP